MPNSNQFEVRIINPGSKSVAIQPGTPVNFSNSMTVQNLRVGGVPPNTNLLLMNFFGTGTPLRVTNDCNIEANGRVLMLYSGLRVNNMLNLQGQFDQEGGELVFTNSFTNTMQIEGGRFTLTNGYVFGKNMYLGGTNDGYVEASGLVSLDWLILGWKSTPPNSATGTYVLDSGWLIVGTFEGVGNIGFGTLIQNGGTNSATDLAVGNGNYQKNGGALFAGEVRLVGTSSGSLLSPSSTTLTHAGGPATITNVLRLVGSGSRQNPRSVTFNMLGGSLSSPRIQLEGGGIFNQSSSTVNVANELIIESSSSIDNVYNLSSGSLFTANTSVSSSFTSFAQSGGTHIVTNTLWINGTAIYELGGGTVTASNIVLTGNLSQPPQVFVLNAPSFIITNQNISMTGGAVVIENSAQQFGRLTIQGDSGINLVDPAILRFADSHTNVWQGGLPQPPLLKVYNWSGSTNGGGTSQLRFGNNSSALTASQLAQIQFLNTVAFGSGPYPARILATGEVVPLLPPVLGFQNNGTNLVLSWAGNFTLQAATNAVGPYFDVPGAPSPYYVNESQFPMQFFRLRN